MQPASRIFFTILSCMAILTTVIGYSTLLINNQLSIEASYLFMPAGLTSAALASLYLALYLRTNASCRNENKDQLLINELITQAQDLIQVLDPKGNILFVNDSWLETLGYSQNEASRMNIFDIIADDCKSGCQTNLEELLNSRGKGRFEVTYNTRNGQGIDLEGNCCISYKNGKPHMVRGIFRDISQRREQDKKIIKMAYFDMLTNLPNRYLLNDRLSQAMHQARRYHQLAGLVYIDIDKFKSINDNYGHKIGDILLQKCARRLKDCLRENDTVSRIGGDEFLLILTGIKSRDDIPKIVEKVRISLAAPYIINNLRLSSSVSLGTAIYPLNGVDQEALLNQADEAMYLAKEHGGNRHCFYDEKITHKTKILRLA